MEPSNKLIKFVTNMDFSDPSYHLPHFYELLPKGLMRRTETSGKKQQLPAERICTVHAMKRQDLAQNMQIMTESLIRGIRKYLEDMTGITVMHTARSPI